MLNQMETERDEETKPQHKISSPSAPETPSSIRQDKTEKSRAKYTAAPAMVSQFKRVE